MYTKQPTFPWGACSNLLVRLSHNNLAVHALKYFELVACTAGVHRLASAATAVVLQIAAAKTKVGPHLHMYLTRGHKRGIVFEKLACFSQSVLCFIASFLIYFAFLYRTKPFSS
jgi:hypothetical protein